MYDTDDIRIYHVMFLKCSEENCDKRAEYVVWHEYGRDYTDSRVGSELYESFCETHAAQYIRKLAKNSRYHDHLVDMTNDKEVIGDIMRWMEPL